MEKKSFRKIAEELNCGYRYVFESVHFHGLGKNGFAESAAIDYTRKKARENMSAKYKISRTKLEPYLQDLKNKIIIVLNNKYLDTNTAFSSKLIFWEVKKTYKMNPNIDRFNFNGVFKKIINDLINENKIEKYKINQKTYQYKYFSPYRKV